MNPDHERFKCYSSTEETQRGCVYLHCSKNSQRRLFNGLPATLLKNFVNTTVLRVIQISSSHYPFTKKQNLFCGQSKMSKFKTVGEKTKSVKRAAKK